jgi:hypothetical protein
MTLTALPDAPSRSDPPATFISKANAFLAGLVTFEGELNAALPTIEAAISAGAAVAGSATAYGTSTTSNTVGTGSKTWTIETGRGFQLGQYVSIADTAAPATNYMLGRITAHNSGTGSLTVSVDTSAGSGTKTAWTVALGAVSGRPAATAANIWAGSSTTVDITPDALFDSMAFIALTEAAAISAWTFADGFNRAVTLTASRTFVAPTGLYDGLSFVIKLKQGGSGSYTVSWPSFYDWGQAGAPSLSTTVGKVDYAAGIYDATEGKARMSFLKAS